TTVEIVVEATRLLRCEIGRDYNSSMTARNWISWVGRVQGIVLPVDADEGLELGIPCEKLIAQKAAGLSYVSMHRASGHGRIQILVIADAPEALDQKASTRHISVKCDFGTSVKEPCVFDRFDTSIDANGIDLRLFRRQVGRRLARRRGVSTRHY